MLNLDESKQRMEKGYEYEIMQFFTWNESEGECRVKLR